MFATDFMAQTHERTTNQQLPTPAGSLRFINQPLRPSRPSVKPIPPSALRSSIFYLLTSPSPPPPSCPHLPASPSGFSLSAFLRSPLFPLRSSPPFSFSLAVPWSLGPMVPWSALSFQVSGFLLHPSPPRSPLSPLRSSFPISAFLLSAFQLFPLWSCGPPSRALVVLCSVPGISLWSPGPPWCSPVR